MPPNPKLQKLESLFKLVDESVGRIEFLKAFAVLTAYLKKMEAQSSQTFTNFATTHMRDVEAKMNQLAGNISVDEFTKMKDRIATLKDGRDGISGLTGEAGKDGMSIIGPAGKDGSPDTPKQVRDKLESLRGEERLDKSAIKGLDDLEKRIQLGASRGGGGMSRLALQLALGKLIKHKTFITSSATTTSTLSERVAGDVCIWLRYNGQMLVYGTHYTISGTTITYTFTLDDSSTVEATWIAG